MGGCGSKSGHYPKVTLLWQLISMDLEQLGVTVYGKHVLPGRFRGYEAHARAPQLINGAPGC